MIFRIYEKDEEITLISQEDLTKEVHKEVVETHNILNEVEADTYDLATQKMYDFFDWGTYKPMD